jgi:triosephosphate isomerase
MKKIIIGNWKMNPTSHTEAKKIYTGVKTKISSLRNVTVAICPPSIYLGIFSATNKGKGGLLLGGQDAHWKDAGACTGDISTLMLKDLRASYVLVGHSERRSAGETDEIVNLKLKAIQDKKLISVLCVGEKERDESGHYLAVIKRQIEDGLEGLTKKAFERLVVAYEPVWAIGKDAKGVETPEGFNHNMIFIRKTLSSIFGQKEASKIPILYGGSVSAQNAESFLREGQADGLLVGRDSLVAGNFVEIVKIANGIKN